MEAATRFSRTNVFVLFFFAFFVIILLSSQVSVAIIEKETYILGETVKIDLKDINEYRLKIETPSTTYLKEGANDVVVFKPQETGTYELVLDFEGDISIYTFTVTSDFDGVIEQDNETADELFSNDSDIIEVSEETGFPLPGENESEIILREGIDQIWVDQLVFRTIEETIPEGSQKIKIRLPDGATGVSVFRNLNGERENISFDLRGQNILQSAIASVFGTNDESSSVILEDVTGDIIIEYIAPGPRKYEKHVSEWEKQVLVASEVHYENVRSYTFIENIIPVDQAHRISVYWNEESTYVSFDAFDLTRDGLIDRIEWDIEHLSNQTFNVTIEIINVQSYPVTGGNWTVNFDTFGSADLHIRAVNGTGWSNEHDNFDLRFLELRCGSELLEYEWTGGGVFVENYECLEQGHETSRVITDGEHILEFNFGGQIAYAFNDALPFETDIADYNGTDWLNITTKRTYTTPVVVAMAFEGADTSAEHEVATVAIANTSGRSFMVQLRNESATIEGNISYIVAENGSHVLSNGMTLQAGLFEPVNNYDANSESTTSYNRITFHEAFAATPTVIASPNNGSAGDWMSVRYDGGTENTTGIDISLELDQTYGNAPIAASPGNIIAWIAMNRTNVTEMEGTIEAAVDEDPTAGDWRTITFNSNYSNPVFFALGEQDGGTDPTRIGFNNLNTTGVQIRQSEERTDGEQTHATEDVLWMVFESGLGQTPPSAPTDIICNGTTSCDIEIDVNITINATNATDEQGDNITYWIEVALLNTTTSGDQESGTQGVSGSPGTVIGETGAVNISNYQWQLVEFTNTYDATPVILATPATQNGAAADDDSYIIPTISSINTTTFNVSICQDNGAATCDTTVAEETVHYFVFDEAAANAYSWIAVGSQTVTTAGADTTLTYGKTFGTTPVLWLTSQTNNQGNNIAPVAWAEDTATRGQSSGPVIGCVHQAGAGASEDACTGGQPSETFGFIAVDTANVNITGWQDGSADISNSDWTPASFSPAYTTPRVMVTENDDDGGQDPEYAWARNVNETDFEFRYCEQDGADDCNSHTSEVTNWFALEQGDIIVPGGNVEVNTSFITYTDIFPYNWRNITELNVTVTVSVFNNSGSDARSNRDPDLELELYNGTGYQHVGNFSITGTGDFTQTVTNETIIAAWLNGSLTNLRIRGVDIDYNDSSTVDELNWTGVDVLFDGRMWNYLGNHTEDDVYVWDTRFANEETNIDVRARAIDPNGSNVFSGYFRKDAHINITHDLPTIEFVSPHTPANNAFLPWDSLAINVTINESYPLNVTYELFNTSGLFNRTIFSTNVEFFNFTAVPDGVYTYNVSIRDESNQTNETETRTVTIDTTFPHVQIDHPQNISYTTSLIEINYTATDTNLGTCWYSLNEGPNTTLSSCANTTFSSPQGDVLFRLYVNDSANNINETENVSYFVDSITPLIEYEAPTALNGSLRPDTFVFVNVSVVETNFANITYTLFNDTAFVNETTYTSLVNTINWTGLDNNFANYTYNVTIVDILGNTNSTETRVLQLTPGDISPPDIFIDSPETEGYSFNSSSILFDVRLSETGDTVIYSLDDGANNITMNTTNDIDYNHTNTSITDGDYEVIFYANDTIGNGGSRSRNFTVDTVFPLIDYTTGTAVDYANLSQDSIFVNVSVTEINERNITFTLYNSTSSILNQTTYTTPLRTINWTGFADDDYLYNVTIYDTAQNVNETQTRRIRLDTTNPNVSLLSPPNATFVNNLTQNLSANFTDNLGLHNITLFVYNLTNDLVNQTTVPDVSTQIARGIIYTFPTDGNYTWSYHAVDSANNEFFSINRSIFFDTTAPLINYTEGTPDNGAELEQQSIFVNITLAETNLVNLTYELFNSTGLVNRSIFTSEVLNLNFTGLPSGNISYLFNVTATDLANSRNSTETRTITLIDTQHPLVTIDNPENTTYSRNTSIPIDFIALDDNLASCWYTLDNGVNNVSLSNCQNTSIDVADEQTYILTLYANDTLGLTNSSNVTFVANSSFIAVDYWLVQRGSLTVDGTQTAALGIEVADTKSFVLHTERSADSGPDSMFVINNMLNSTTVQFDNYATGAGATVEWEVITGPNITARRGVEAFGTGDGTFTASIGDTLNLSASFLVLTTRINDGTGSNTQEGNWRGRFINSTDMEFTRGVTGTSGELSWQAVEWTAANVQNGSFSVSALTGTQDLPSAVTLNRSFLIFSFTTTSGNALDYNNIGGYFVDSDTVGFYRDDDDAGFMFVDYFVVEYDQLDVQRGDYTITGATSPVFTPIPRELINQSKSFHRSSWDSTGSGTTHANAILTTEIQNTSDLQSITGTTGTNVKNVSWQTIEFLESDAPIVDLLAPVDGFNFSNFTTSQFNYSVADESNVLNCSLYGNWTTSFHLNQTQNNPTKETTNSFSSVNVGEDGFYIWNVECTDRYGNIGTNTTNFTFAAYIFPEGPALFNVTQTSNDGLGNVTLFWNSSNHSRSYRVYYNSSLTGEFVLLGETSGLTFVDNSSAGEQRRFYRVDGVNPTGQNASSDYFGMHLYNLHHNSNTRNWLGLPSNATYLSNANHTLQEIRNATSFTMWNETIQGRVTCNDFSCPNFPSCTDTNCNFDLDAGRGYEVNINSSASSDVNWSLVGIVYDPATISLVKNDTDFGKNWIAIYANTTLLGASDILQNISNSDATTNWNATLQTSQGLIPHPFGGGYLGTNFTITMERAYEVSVNTSLSWDQI